MSEYDVTAAVDALVGRLFTMGGTDEQAHRLVLRQDNPPRDLGGWCRSAITDEITAALQDAREDMRQRCQDADVDFPDGFAEYGSPTEHRAFNLAVAQYRHNIAALKEQP